MTVNNDYAAAHDILNLVVPCDTLEGVVVMLEANARATLALADAQHTANLLTLMDNADISKPDGNFQDLYVPVVHQLRERLGVEERKPKEEK